jgi:ribosomal-protein-alanine N-acetyltransferase
MDQDPEDLAELLDPHSWPDHYYAVMDAVAALDPAGGELVGFFCFEAEQDVVSIGLGLRPDLTGKGLGQAFCEAGLQFARESFNPRTFALDVATFNQRAIALYRKLGFEDCGVSLQQSNGGQYEFLHMIRAA